ncbi:MAG: hypothetical protein DI622_01520 [Chryseobacterium sp.]|uniref:hypothetical protein n=1 Tax=Chryseobacterium sp. TaxID=1871047 RepID=UPI000DB5B01C|nr:hypothetical protein [Chryseobacterium sp.]MPS64242.1 hypothetical protein [Chryseobacterium sp.]PZU26132.1 MAG: hypothetical protein DI622_01520 [Chryseobacterium sp.]
MQRIVKEGNWKYSDEHFEKIIIVEQDWDQFYEEGYSEDPPYLNSKGYVYYIHFGNYWINEYGNICPGSISIPFLSKEEAEEYAKNQVSDLMWNKSSKD